MIITYDYEYTHIAHLICSDKSLLEFPSDAVRCLPVFRAPVDASAAAEAADPADAAATATTKPLERPTPTYNMEEQGKPLPDLEVVALIAQSTNRLKIP